MHYVRSKIFDVFLVIWTFVFGAAIPVLLVARKPAWVRAGTRIWCRGTMMALRRIVGLKYEVLGKDNILPPPALYVCNHQSSWETFAACILIPDVAIVTKLELMHFPVFGWYLRHSPMIAVDRTAGASAMRSMVRQAKEAIAKGRSVLIYAEGTRCAVHEHRPFKSGVVALYRSLNIPVVPMAVNSGIFWRNDTSMKYHGKVSVSFLAPIRQGMDGSKFKQTIEQLIYDEKDALIRNCTPNNDRNSHPAFLSPR